MHCLPVRPCVGVQAVCLFKLVDGIFIGLTSFIAFLLTNLILFTFLTSLEQPLPLPAFKAFSPAEIPAGGAGMTSCCCSKIEDIACCRVIASLWFLLLSVPAAAGAEHPACPVSLQPAYPSALARLWHFDHIWITKLEYQRIACCNQVVITDYSV